jgi:phosphate system positive regulatory protein PHO4
LSKKADIHHVSDPSEASGIVSLMEFKENVLTKEQQEGSNRNSFPDIVGTTSLKDPIMDKSTLYTNDKMARKSPFSCGTSPILCWRGSRELSPTLMGNVLSSKKPTVKKASHRLAEQGRRNRMNMAIQKLSNLIPREYRDSVSIPSKATTIELASMYIKDLIDKNNEMKYHNLQH